MEHSLTKCIKCGVDKVNADECPSCGVIYAKAEKVFYENLKGEVNKETAKNLEICPYCAEEIKANAIKCKHCGEWLSGKHTGSIEDVQQPSLQSKNSRNTIKDSDIPLPLEAKGLKLNPQNFTFRGRTYQYKRITSILFKYTSGVINFVSYTEIIFKLKLTNNEVIKIVMQKRLWNKEEFSALYESCNFLNNLTHGERTRRYMLSLEKKGYIDYKYSSGNIRMPKSVRIFGNGTLETNGKKINLRKARNSGVLVFGTNFDVPLRYKNVNPNEIAVSENKNASYLGALKINAEWDTAIIHNIIDQLSQGKVFSRKT